MRLHFQPVLLRRSTHRGHVVHTSSTMMSLRLWLRSSLQISRAGPRASSKRRRGASTRRWSLRRRRAE
jgi:hypothetical protein